MMTSINAQFTKMADMMKLLADRQEEQERQLQNSRREREATASRKRKRVEHEFEDEEDDYLSPSSSQRDQDDEEEGSDEDTLEPVYRKNTPIMKRFKRRDRRDIIEEIGNPWTAIHLKEKRKEFEVTVTDPKHPLPGPRTAELEALKKPRNKALQAKYKTLASAARKVEKILNALVYSNDNYEAMWARVYATTALQSALLTDEIKAVLLEAQGVKDTTRDDSFFTTEEDVREVKDARETALTRAALKGTKGGAGGRPPYPRKTDRGDYKGAGKGTDHAPKGQGSKKGQ